MIFYQIKFILSIILIFLPSLTRGRYNNDNHGVGSLLFNDEGRILQLEYAQQAAQNYGHPFLAAVCQDGVVLFSHSRQPIDRHHQRGLRLIKTSQRWSIAPKVLHRLHHDLACTLSGFPADSDYVLQHLHMIVSEHYQLFGENVPIKKVANKVAEWIYEHGLPKQDSRPLAINLLLCQAKPLPMICSVTNSGSVEGLGRGAILASWELGSDANRKRSRAFEDVEDDEEKLKKNDKQVDANDDEERGSLKSIYSQLCKLDLASLNCAKVKSEIVMGEDVEVSYITIEGLQSL
eukprot:gene4077-4459_t